MLFNSASFFVYLVATFLAYYLAPKRWQVGVLVVASFFFYAYSAPALLSLLLLSVLLNSVCAYYMFRAPTGGAMRSWALLGIVANLGVLVFFKYAGLFAGMLLDPGHDVAAFLIHLPLPIGISFFSFHGISMMMDFLRKKNFERYAFIADYSFPKLFGTSSLYIAFFPQLVSGPIVKSYDFLPQIAPKQFRAIEWGLVLQQLIIGYFLKQVVADNLKDQTYWISYPYFEAYDSLTLLALLVGYSMQIFSDFAGYSLIALGLANMFGYKLPVNFNFPYISRTFGEFWSRWHISLSSWLREYLYIPLGGNRKGTSRTYINLMLVMFIGGLWHGAAWSYAVWGTFHGVALAVERLLGNYIKPRENWINKAWQMLVVFVFVTFAWLLFKLPDFSQAVQYLRAMFLGGGKRNVSIVFLIAVYSLPVVLYHFHFLLRAQMAGYRRMLATVKPVALGIMLFLIMVNSGIPGSFIYFQF